MNAVRKVLIVGGGTAGWLTAAYLARTLGAGRPGGLELTLVESPDISIVGVGEGTFPSIRGALSAIGVPESDFLESAGATFKQGVKFAHWVRPAGSPGDDHYFHPFNAPSSRVEGLELLPYWLMGLAGPGAAFASSVTMQKRVADASRGPRRAGGPDYQAPMNYAYHLDAGRFAETLRVQAVRLGAVHLPATVERVELGADGAVAAVHTREAGALGADLYIDCSGFRALLIGQALGSAFRSLADTLFVDRAVAMQVPYPRPDAPIASYTISTAHEAGWTWDIGLPERRGVGYVYSSSHTSDARAQEVLRGYIGPMAEGREARVLRFEVGYRPVQWIGNCVAVGLSSGFLEPLESSGIGLIESAAYLIAHLFPHGGELQAAARQFNAQMSARYERIADFLKLHYCLSQRTDSDFWMDNRRAASIPDPLAEKLAMWRTRPPHRLDFVADHEMYLPGSWQFVLYGMEFRTELAPALEASLTRGEEARREFAMIRQVAERAVGDLPDHRTLLKTIRAGRPAELTA